MLEGEDPLMTGCATTLKAVAHYAGFKVKSTITRCWLSSKALSLASAAQDAKDGKIGSFGELAPDSVIASMMLEPKR